MQTKSSKIQDCNTWHRCSARNSKAIGTLYVPGHIGTITNTTELTFIHTDTQRGKVTERPVRSLEFAIGYIAVDIADSRY